MLRPWSFDIQLKHRTGVGVQFQIVQALIEEIRRGRLSMGSPMPGSRDLAKRLLVNRKTVVLAYDELVAQGWLVTQGRRGTFVAATFPVSGNTAARGLSKSSTKMDSRGGLSSSAVQETLLERNTLKAKWVDFNDGVPDSRMIPYAALSRAFRHAINKTSQNNQLGYEHSLGSTTLRQSLAQMLNMERGLACNEDNICLVRGSQMGIYLASRVLIRAGDCAVFEKLSYSPAREAFRSSGATIFNVEQDAHGLIPEGLEKVCRKNRVRAVYVTPHHQYPTTVMMPADRRLRLLALAERFDFILVEDDYDHEFNFDHRPAFPIASVDRSGRVIYVGSMSKVLAPGLRVGYIAASPEIIGHCSDAVMQIDRQGNSITELAVNELLTSGELKRHLRRSLRIYELRRNSAARVIQDELSNVVEFDVPPGGLALWLRLKRKVDYQRLAPRLAENKARLMPPEFFSEDKRTLAGIRLGYASLDEEGFKRGIQLLRKALLETLT